MYELRIIQLMQGIYVPQEASDDHMHMIGDLILTDHIGSFASDLIAMIYKNKKLYGEYSYIEPKEGNVHINYNDYFDEYPDLIVPKEKFIQFLKKWEKFIKLPLKEELFILMDDDFNFYIKYTIDCEGKEKEIIL